jgi:hypothetical protein
VLARLRVLLADRGTLQIRIPVAGSYAWRTYGVHWLDLDAPRHLFLQTPRSMRLLAEATGFDVESTTFDSDASQFWGSEQYLRGIPLWSSDSYLLNPAAAGFTEEQIDGYSRKADELNASGDGATACFLLRKSGV